MSGSIRCGAMVWTHATNFGISRTTPNTSCEVSSVLVRYTKPVSGDHQSIAMGIENFYLLKKPSTFSCLGVCSFVEDTKVRVVGDSFGRYLRSEDNNIERFLFPLMIGGFGQLSKGIYNLLPLKKSQRPSNHNF